jgi:hypothetical protein
MNEHWEQYLAALGKSNKPTSTSSVIASGDTSYPFETTSTKIGVSGFLDLKPVSTSAQQFQARYDAMSGSWEGVHASEKAVLKSKTDKTEFMPITHEQNKSQQHQW